MADIERFGRTFTFDDSVSDAQRETRIQNWMQKNAPDELTKESAPPKSTPKQESARPSGKSDTLSDKMAQSFGRGVAGGYGDELTAAVRATTPGLSNWMMRGPSLQRDESIGGPGPAPQTVSDAGTWQDRYDQELGRERTKAKDFSDTSPFLSGASNIAGTLATIPLGMGLASAAAKTPVVGARLAALIAKNPWLASAGIGATSAGVTGFGEGEGGYESRLSNAGESALWGAGLGLGAHGAVKLVGGIGNRLGLDNRVARYLRERASQEKSLDTASPTFTPDLMAKLRGEMADQTALKTEPIVGDLLPKTSEAMFTKPSKGGSELAKAYYTRQYDRDLSRNAAPGSEALALEKSQFGRIGNTFDTSFGPDTFKGTHEQLLADRRAAADQAYTPAYREYVNSPEIENALLAIEDIAPGVLTKTQAAARSESRLPGTGRLPAMRDVNGQTEYNTQYLHDIKRFLDEAVGEGQKGNFKFNEMPFVNAKKALNKGIMDVNDPYKQAMLKYGEDSDLIEAFRKGREDVFHKDTDKFGAGLMDDADIVKYLADPLIPQAQKDLFKVSAARTAREKFLGSDSKKFTHNWAAFIDNPKNRANLEALTEGHQLGSWNLFRNRLMKEHENYTNATKAMGNSATIARQGLKEEAESGGGDLMALLGMIAFPKAPSTARLGVSSILRKIDPTTPMYSEVSSLLAKKPPPAGGGMNVRDPLDKIERLLREQEARVAMYRRAGAYAPVVAGQIGHRKPRNDE